MEGWENGREGKKKDIRGKNGRKGKKERKKGRNKHERERKKKEKQILLELRKQNADRNRDCFSQSVPGLVVSASFPWEQAGSCLSVLGI